MRVDPNSDTSMVAAAAVGKPAGPHKLGRDTATLTSADELNRALAQTPEVRAEKVAQAAALVQDTSYPPQVLIHKLSVLFAAKLMSPPAGENSEPAANPETANETTPADDSQR